jgi:hypothetical protein
MASWGNAANQQYLQDMDSNGKRLRVVGNESGAWWQVMIESDHEDAQALLVIGKAAFRDGEIRGTIKPNAALNSLDINAESNDDPDVHIGCGGDISAGNKVFLLGKHIYIGNTASDFYRVAIGGPVLVGVRLQVPTLQADSETQTPSVDTFSNDIVLNLGTTRATEVLIGRTGHDTIVRGLLSVSGLVEMSNGLLVSGGNIDTNGTVNAGSVQAGSVDASSVHTTGNIICSAAIVAEHDIVTRMNAMVGGSIQCTGSVTAASFNTSGGLAVGGESRFDREAVFNESVVVHGETYHENALRMQSQPIIMGGEGDSEVKMICRDKQLEFYIGGKMTFYIDKGGGHNA